MTTPAQDAPLVLPAVAFRPARLGVICLVLTAVAVGLGQWLQHPLFGVFFGIGLALGLINALLIRRSVQNITAADHPLKSKMAMNSAGRLFTLSVIALGIGYVFKPTGLGVVLGLALFEILLVASTALPVVRKLRSAAAAGATYSGEDSVEGTAQ